MSEKLNKDYFISRTEISDILEDWKKIKLYLGTKSDSETLRTLIKKIGRLIDSKQLPP